MTPKDLVEVRGVKGLYHRAMVPKPAVEDFVIDLSAPVNQVQYYHISNDRLEGQVVWDHKQTGVGLKAVLLGTILHNQCYLNQVKYS